MSAKTLPIGPAELAGIMSWPAMQYAVYWRLQDVCKPTVALTKKQLQLRVYWKARKAALAVGVPCKLVLKWVRLPTGEWVWEVRVIS